MHARAQLSLCAILFLSAMSGGALAQTRVAPDRNRPAPSAPQVATRWTPELALQVKTINNLAVAPDGQRIAYQVGAPVMDRAHSEWVSQIYVAAADGSREFRLTSGDVSSTRPAWSPDGRWIAFISARDGKPNIWRIRVAGGEGEQLTDETGGVSDLQWSPDGSAIAFLMGDPTTAAEDSAKKEKRDWEVVDQDIKMTRLYLLSLRPDSTGKRPVRKLTEGDYSIEGGFDWSPDGKEIVFAHQATPKPDDWPTSDISVVDVAGGTERSLVATHAAESEPMYTPDGTRIAFTASDDPPTWGSLSRAYLVPAAGGAPQPLADTFDQQPQPVGWSRGGKALLIEETQHTIERLSALPLDGKPELDVSPPDVMVSGPAVNDSGTVVAFVGQGPDRAPEVFVTKSGSFKPTQVSHLQEIPAIPIGRTEVVSWQAPDGKTIEGLLTYPVQYQAGSRVPLLLVIHGGPTGVFVQDFIARRGAYPIAAFASDGYAVLRANPRGSSGYGRDFRYANYGDWGGGDYQDLMAGVDAMVQRGIADPDRLGVMGWSYGGYMTSWIITQTHRFKAASVGAGVTDLISFTGTSDIPGFIPDYFAGDSWVTGDAWRAHSAIFNVKGVTTPTLIQHGGADQRVPTTQGYELYNALKRQGVTTTMVVYPRQPHGLQEPKLQLDSMRRNLEWFGRWILGKGQAGGGTP